jgi:glycerol-3-phosphate dehydrogenase
MAGVTKNLITLLYGYLKGYGYSETQASYVVAKTMHEIEERHPSLRTKHLLPAWNVDIWMSAHTGTRNVRCGIHLGQSAADPEHGDKEIGTSEGWRTLHHLPHHEYLNEIEAFRLLYQLLVKKEISQERFEQALFN